MKLDEVDDSEASALAIIRHGVLANLQSGVVVGCKKGSLGRGIRKEVTWCLNEYG